MAPADDFHGAVGQAESSSQSEASNSLVSLSVTLLLLASLGRGCQSQVHSLCEQQSGLRLKEQSKL